MPRPAAPSSSVSPSNDGPVDNTLIYICGGIVGFALLLLLAAIVFSGGSAESDAEVASTPTSTSETNVDHPAGQTDAVPSGNTPLTPATPQVAIRFPDLDSFRTLEPSGVKVAFVDTTKVAEKNVFGPATQMTMRVYLPPGEHDAASLPCVLVAPAGTNLLCGNQIEDDDYHDETLPYAKAQMAVVLYSLDGPMNPEGSFRSEKAFTRAMQSAYSEFKAAEAGVANGRMALDFVLEKMPQVDPSRIYSAGHSSAGTLSLLLAVHEPRLKACIAFAPATNVRDRLSALLNIPNIERLLPGIQQFVDQESPATYLDKYQRPLFLFHARDDSNEPYSSTESFAQQLESNGKPVTFVTAEHGDHYQSMIDEGIPAAVQWLTELP